MEREVEGGIGMGNTCKSMADSCQVWQKPLQYCKVISLQLIKINGEKKKSKKLKKTKKKHNLEFPLPHPGHPPTIPNQPNQKPRCHPSPPLPSPPSSTYKILLTLPHNSSET